MPYEEYYSGVDDEQSLNVVNLKKQAVIEAKKADKNYQKYTQTLISDDNRHKKVSVECYGSGQFGSRIRNAVTGQYTPYLVGSKDEDLFFVVSDCIGRKGRIEPLTLYYDTPEQYENHQFVSLQSSIKEKWHKKNLVARQN